MTGVELVRQLRSAASSEGVSLNRFVRPLTTDPTKFIQQMEDARKPTPITIERVRALIEGRPIPPHRNGFTRQPQQQGLTRIEAEALGFPPSGRSVAERHNLASTLERKRQVERLRDLSQLARETRRPGQPVADRLHELRRDMAA